MEEKDLKEALDNLLKRIEKSFEEKLSANKEWMSLKEGAAYAGVSYNTFLKYRLLGLKITVIDGIKRISKTEIDRFLNENTF